jgi:polar amino acid transport system substrate-binding protein
MADRLKIRFRFVEVPSVQEQIEGVATGKFDIATAAVTVTADRGKSVDFTQPFFSTGLGVATPLNREPSWRPVLRALTSFGFLQGSLR